MAQLKGMGSDLLANGDAHAKNQEINTDVFPGFVSVVVQWQPEYGGFHLYPENLR